MSRMLLLCYLHTSDFYEPKSVKVYCNTLSNTLRVEFLGNSIIVAIDRCILLFRNS